MDIDVRKALTQSDSADNVRVTFNVWQGDTPELRAIITEHLVNWADLFGRKNSEYGSGSAFDLGERGQFSDMYRKMIKLKRAMWDEDESVLTTEGVDEIIMDLIGHCFLTLEMRARKTRVAPEPEDQTLTPEMFRKLVEDAGLFIIDTSKPADLGIELESYQDAAGRIWRVGDPVRFKQHLGKGEPVIIDGFDRNREDGQVVLLRNTTGTIGSTAHPLWLYKDGERSPEEIYLENLRLGGADHVAPIKDVLLDEVSVIDTRESLETLIEGEGGEKPTSERIRDEEEDDELDWEDQEDA